MEQYQSQIHFSNWAQMSGKELRRRRFFSQTFSLGEKIGVSVLDQLNLSYLLDIQIVIGQGRGAGKRHLYFFESKMT